MGLQWLAKLSLGLNGSLRYFYSVFFCPFLHAILHSGPDLHHGQIALPASPDSLAFLFFSHSYFSGYISGMFIPILISASQMTQSNTVTIICTSLQYHSVLYYWIRSCPLIWLQQWHGGLERTWTSHLEDLGIVLDDLGQVKSEAHFISSVKGNNTNNNTFMVAFNWNCALQFNA